MIDVTSQYRNKQSAKIDTLFSGFSDISGTDLVWYRYFILYTVLYYSTLYCIVPDMSENSEIFFKFSNQFQITIIMIYD